MLLYKSRVFDLYSTDTSSRRPPFEYVVHRGSCAALILDQSENVGLLAHHREAIGRTLFEIPAGMLDLDRPTDEILSQELKEETGLEVAPAQLNYLSTFFASPGYSSEALSLFFIRVSPEQRRVADGLRWFTLPELNELIQKSELVDMKTVLAITAYQAVLWKGTGDELI